MAKNIPLTLACGDYELTRALKEGAVEPDGIDLTVLTRLDSNTRHWRFLRNGEFDVAECSCSSYLVARDQGQPFDAIPVFLHRRFRHGFIYVNTAAGIREPKDLIGKKVGVKQYQSSALLWLRGILEDDYGVPHRSIRWFSDVEESIPFDKPADLELTRLPEDRLAEAMLAEGELDAMMHPDIIEPILAGDPRVGRLFPDYRAEEQAFFRRTGIFPIMHVMGIRREIVERHPWIPANLYRAFEEAKAVAMTRMVNPRIVPLAWYMEQWEEERALLGPDPWEYGMTEGNRAQLERLARYSHEQGMSRNRMAVDDLFLGVSQGRKREEKFRV